MRVFGENISEATAIIKEWVAETKGAKMKKLENGDEVSVGGKKYRAVNDELFVVLDEEPPKETQLDRIERKLGELDERVKERDVITIPYLVPYYPLPQPQPQYPWQPYYPTWTITNDPQWIDGSGNIPGSVQCGNSLTYTQ